MLADQHLASNGKKATERGRFISEDPSGLDGGINMYVFGNNDPINTADPSGLRSLTSDEIAAMGEICHAIDCGSVDLRDLGWSPGSGMTNTQQDIDESKSVSWMVSNTGMTLGQTVRINMYRDDQGFDLVLAHELTHVWQNTHLWSPAVGALIGIGAQESYYLSKAGLGQNPYSIWGIYFGGQSFTQYKSEQQANIAAACIVQQNQAACGVPGFPFVQSAWQSR